MTIIYSGFDTIVFAVKGALSPEAIQRMEHVKANAETERRDLPLHVKEGGLQASISPNGRKGGYAFVIAPGHWGKT